jgi:hypothetical protein
MLIPGVTSLIFGLCLGIAPVAERPTVTIPAGATVTIRHHKTEPSFVALATCLSPLAAEKTAAAMQREKKALTIRTPPTTAGLARRESLEAQPVAGDWLAPPAGRVRRSR